MNVWLLIIVCVQSLLCSQGATWHSDKVYITKEDCESAGKRRVKSGEVLVCIEGNMDQKQ